MELLSHTSMQVTVLLETMPMESSKVVQANLLTMLSWLLDTVMKMEWTIG